MEERQQRNWNDGADAIVAWTKRRWKLMVALGALLIIGTCSFGSFNGIYNGSVERENRLNAQYQDNQNYLSAYISGFFEQVSVVKAGGAQLNTVLEDAVKGRYEGKTSAQPGTGSLFSAILEAYPEASLAELQRNWGKIQSFVEAQREGYRNIQSKLLDMLREYDVWRQRGLIRRFFVNFVGVPSERLVARIGDKKWTGQEALDKMFQIVLTAEAKRAYETGEQAPLEVPTS